MHKSDFPRLLSLWAERHGLRYVATNGHHRGIIDGVALDAHEFAGEIVVHFFSPSVSLLSEIANEFIGFTNFASTGVSTKSLNGSVTHGELDEHSCVMRLTPGHVHAADFDVVLNIPALIVKDFMERGAADQPLVCGRCGATGPSQVVQFGSKYQTICDECYRHFQEAANWTPDDAPQSSTPVNWPMAIIATAISTLIFGIAWGWIQHPNFRVRFLLLLALPMFGVFVHARTILRFSRGVSPALVKTIDISAILWILIGNVMGLSFAVANQGINALWTDVFWMYFNQYLPANWQSESLYFVGGFVGIYFTLKSLKPESYRQIARYM